LQDATIISDDLTAIEELFDRELTPEGLSFATVVRFCFHVIAASRMPLSSWLLLVNRRCSMLNTWCKLSRCPLVGHEVLRAPVGLSRSFA